MRLFFRFDNITKISGDAGSADSQVDWAKQIFGYTTGSDQTREALRVSRASQTLERLFSCLNLSHRPFKDFGLHHTSVEILTRIASAD